MSVTMKKIRMLLDIAMTIMFIILMGYYITGNTVHEILGTIIFILFIIHNILNIKWYKSIFKGKHEFKRTFHIIINLLLFLSMIGMMVSGIMISSKVFSFLNIPTTMFARRLHMVSTSWGFVLMSIHVGLHITGMMNKLNNKMKNNTFEYVYYFVLILIIGFGVYSFITNKVYEDMFLMNDFKFFDYEQSPILFYLKYVTILGGVALFSHFILKLITNIKNNES